MHSVRDRRCNAFRVTILSVPVILFLADGSAFAVPALPPADDLSIVPLFDGRRSELLNTWGGAWGLGNMREIGLQGPAAPGGPRSLYAELGPVKPGEIRYLQCFASGFGRDQRYCQTRDLTRYQRLWFSLRNMTPAAMRGRLQLKDYRDSAEHQATYRFELPPNGVRLATGVALPPGDGHWTLAGQPDLSRILTIDVVFEPREALASGRVCFDGLALVEPGGPADIATSPLTALVERLTHRQWDALWAARSRTSGMIPNTSYQASDGALNTTASVLWMLPAATRRHWVAPEAADQYVSLLVATLDHLLDRARYLPPRFVDWVTLQPSLWPEESSVDAAFLALALHQYKSLPSTSARLRTAINRVENRFDFAAFACPRGWRMAYRYAAPACKAGFVACVYDGYTNEGNLISLAAHLSRRHHVAIETYWNTSVHRVHAALAGNGAAPVVHSCREFRAPFAQALWNLFVDVRQRGIDSYPDASLATNPWQNFVGYEQEALGRLAAEGRRYLAQPDAGNDGTLTHYQPFSLYDSFGQSDLFMPWSASFCLLAGADGSGEAMRFLLRHHLHGAFGMADSARWTTGQPEPYAITARQDLWNTGLATMALLEWLDGPARLSRSFAGLPEVSAALDHVFPSRVGKKYIAVSEGRKTSYRRTTATLP